jgi:hypothetical protein
MPAFAGVRVNSWVKLHHPRALSQPLDDVGCDITDAYELALGFPQPWPTPEGFITPSPGSPASLPFQVQQVKFAHCNLRSSSSRNNETTAGAIAEWQKGLTA